jgi:hypothetical protein
MRTFYTMLFLFVFTLASSQNNNYTFARDVFKKEYKEQTYEPYKGVVTVVDSITIMYGEQVLIIPTREEKYRGIFTHHANLFADNYLVTTKTDEEFEAMTREEQLQYMLGRNDTINIINFEELEELNPNAKTKRFIFWRFHGNMLNPTEYYFELKNDKATRRTPLSEFIAGARLTFLYKGTIIL